MIISQTEHSTKCQELLQLRIDFRELQQHFDELEEELNKQKTQNLERDGEKADMQIEVESLRCQLRKYESMESIDKTRCISLKYSHLPLNLQL